MLSARKNKSLILPIPTPDLIDPEESVDPAKQHARPIAVCREVIAMGTVYVDLSGREPQLEHSLRDTLGCLMEMDLPSVPPARSFLYLAASMSSEGVRCVHSWHPIRGASRGVGGQYGLGLQLKNVVLVVSTVLLHSDSSSIRDFLIAHLLDDAYD